MTGRSVPDNTYVGSSGPNPIAIRNVQEGSARHQITGVPMENDPPPLILLRCNVRQLSKNVVWEFYAKYTVTVEYHRNQFRYDPIDMNVEETTSWSGGGNLNMVSCSGAPYNNRQLPFPITNPFRAPQTDSFQAAINFPMHYYTTAPHAGVASRTRSKTTKIDEEE